MSMVIDVKYELGHSYTERWEVSDLYCPHCGDQSVWIEDAGGDYLRQAASRGDSQHMKLDTDGQQT